MVSLALNGLNGSNTMVNNTNINLKVNLKTSIKMDKLEEFDKEMSLVLEEAFQTIHKDLKK